VLVNYADPMDWPPRKLVSIGDQMVCTRVMGRGPAVVLEAGGAGEGTTGTFGGVVEEQLAAFATVLTYDRVGSGGSGHLSRGTVEEMADDLDAVIRATNCPTPAVIVAWSAGGMVAEMFAVRHPDKVAGLVLLDPTEFTSPRFLRDTPSSRLILAVEGPLNVWWCKVIGLLMLLRLPRTRAGRAVLRRTAATDLSHDKLERIYRYTDNHPRAMLETAQLLRLLVPYYRETKAALSSAALPDVPMRIISPQPRPGWPPQLAHIDAAHRALVARFPRGKFVSAEGATHQWLPFERPDVTVAVVRDVLNVDSQ
jgi:pimeloyl-ACP methyl ester carboxylesterase